MIARALLLGMCACGLAACSGGSGLSTASILGGGSNAGAATAASPAPPPSTPTSRAFNIGMVTARATKCGYNFDPAKLKANYLAYERALSASADMTQIERTYDVSFNGVAKAVASESDYCSPEKTKTIKADLARHLAGDYTPSAPPKKQLPLV